jgi:putative serine protease PepD
MTQTFPAPRATDVPPAFRAPEPAGPTRPGVRRGVVAALVATGTVAGLAVGSVAGATAALTVDDLGLTGSGSGSDTVVESDADGAAAPALSADDADAGSSDVPAQDTGAVDWATVADRITPSTVSIEVRSGDSGGEGTGFMLDDEGHILTNNHVVAPGGASGSIAVTLNDGRVLEATITGLDPATDLAVVQLVNPPDDLQPATLGDSSAVGVGDPVMAVGNPLGLSGTVTTGIVSAVDRPVSTGDGQGTTVVTAAIQTDAAVNPGNSGGPLVDATGAVVGINSSIASLGGGLGGQAGSIGLGFAIPVDEAKEVAAQLIEDGTADHAQLGVSVADTVTETDGAGRAAAQIAEVVPGSPAAEAGLEAGDAVLAVEGRPTSGALSLTAIVRSYQPGETVTLTVARDGGTVEIDAVLGVADTRTS